MKMNECMLIIKPIATHSNRQPWSCMNQQGNIKIHWNYKGKVIGMKNQGWNMKSCFNCNWRKCKNQSGLQNMVHNLDNKVWLHSIWCIDELCFFQDWRWMLTHHYSYKHHFLPKSRQCILQTTCSPSS